MGRGKNSKYYADEVLNRCIPSHGAVMQGQVNCISFCGVEAEKKKELLVHGIMSGVNFCSTSYTQLGGIVNKYSFFGGEGELQKALNYEA